MRLQRRRPREHPETIVALIDVVFFLLVFFMIVGRMDATAPFEVTPPLARSGTDMPGGGSTISVALDGALALDGRSIDRDALLADLAQTIAADPDRLVRVNAHRDAPLRGILPLVAEIEALAPREVVLVVTEGLQ